MVTVETVTMVTGETVTMVTGETVTMVTGETVTVVTGETKSVQQTESLVNNMPATAKTVTFDPTDISGQPATHLSVPEPVATVAPNSEMNRYCAEGSYRAGGSLVDSSGFNSSQVCPPPPWSCLYKP
ncbi:hypothetical protein Bbelb_203040 [Branchiostoma belcheri]|nr:hypothetical protein Bbelb_203040 [Branchiostoma belcheri]